MGGFSSIVFFSFISWFFAFVLAMILLVVLYFLFNYIFESLAITKMIHSPLGWIPFYNKYLLGKITNKKELGIIRSVISVLITLMILVYYYLGYSESWYLTVLFLLMVVGFILDLILSTVIYKVTYPKLETLFVIISILSLGFFRPIILFCVSTNESIKIISSYETNKHNS